MTSSPKDPWASKDPWADLAPVTPIVPRDEPPCDEPGCWEDTEPTPILAPQPATIIPIREGLTPLREQDPPTPLNAPGARPPFPTYTLPEVMRDMVECVATSTQTDPALPGAAALGTIAACATGRIRIKINDDWTVPLNLYIAPTAHSGERKTPAFTALTDALEEAETELRAQWRPGAAIARARREVAEDAVKKAKRRITEAKPGTDETVLLAELDSAVMALETHNVPVKPRLLTDDTTPEALAKVLANHNGSTAIMSDEGGIFATIGGRYNDGKANLDIFLKGYDGRKVTIDRVGNDDTIDIPTATLTMCVALQPHVLNQLAANREFGERGLVPRFLYAICNNNIGNRDPNPPPVPPATANAWTNLVKTLAHDMANQEALTLTLTPEALQVVLDYGATTEPRLGPEGDLAEIRSWAAKSAGHMIRLAGILHLTQHHTKPTISGSTMNAAQALITYFTAHAIAAFRAFATDPVKADAIYLLGKLHSDKVTDITIRDILRRYECKALQTTADVKAAMEVLEEYGWVTEAEPTADSKSKPGRRRSPIYLVHPPLDQDQP